ncbi:HCaRG [Phytophthora cactorum]|nr:HCaRG [Phytophthora cactorum]
MSRSFAADERVLESVAQASELSAESESTDWCFISCRARVHWVIDLRDLGADFGEICKLAVRLFGSDKQSKRRLTRTASASGWEAEQMEKAVLAVAKILMDSAKAEMSEHAFRLVLKGMTLPEQHVDVLAQVSCFCCIPS